RATAVRPDGGRRRRHAVAEKVLAHLARGVLGDRVEVGVGERSSDALRNARMTLGAIRGEQHAPAPYRVLAEFLVEVGDQVFAGVIRRLGVPRFALAVARLVKVRLVRLGGNEEIED